MDRTFKTDDWLQRCTKTAGWVHQSGQVPNLHWNLWPISTVYFSLMGYLKQVGKRLRNYLNVSSTLAWEIGAQRITQQLLKTSLTQMARPSVVSHSTVRVPGNVGWVFGYLLTKYPSFLLPHTTYLLPKEDNPKSHSHYTLKTLGHL